MEKIPTRIKVVAAAISRKGGVWLMQKRPPDKQHGGLWEFPGGKVELGEVPENALIREIQEELDIILDRGALRLVGTAEGPDASGTSTIVISLYTSTVWSGAPRAMEGGNFGWFTPKEIESLKKPPLDVILAEQMFGRNNISHG